MDVYCRFCGRSFREGDHIYRMSVGTMSWSSKSGYLYCDPLFREDKKRIVEELIHHACFHDGPEHHETELLAAELEPRKVNHPHCTVCGLKFDAGDQVYMIQQGTLSRMNFVPEIMYTVIPRELHVLAVHTHTTCVCCDAEVHMPTIPEAQEEVDWDY